MELNKANMLLNLLTLVIALSFGQVRSNKRPNIFLIMADDLGWADVGFRDPAMHTPNIDELARDGIILDQMYMQHSCSPSRAAMLTGLYPFRMGLQHSVIGAGKPEYLPSHLQILPQYLKRLGYRTHIVGKWHLGFCHWSLTPTYRGFDSFYGFYNALEGYYNHTGKKDGYDFRDNEAVDWSARGTYSTYLFADRTQRILREHDRNDPFFMYLSFQAVHGPFEVPQYYIDNYCSHIADDARRVKCGMVAAMDEAIGNVTRTLHESGMADDTLILFLSDNGGSTKKGSSNWPLRGSKTTLWEGGNRVVGFVQSTNRQMLPGSGSTFPGMMHAVDLFPTLLQFAGASRSDLPRSIDGRAMWNSIRRARPRSPRLEMVYNIDDVKQNAAIRLGRWKLLVGKGGRPNDWVYPIGGAATPPSPPRPPPSVQLFNLEQDPNEMHNLAPQKSRLVQRLTRRLNLYRSDVVPSVEHRPLPASHPRYFNNTWSPGFCTPQ